MKIVFFGSDDFAATSLDKLIREGHQVAGVVTKPDRARGRGMKITLLPVKMIALEHLIPLFQPENLEDPEFKEKIFKLQADLFVVIAYGKILPPALLAMPEKYCVNVHASLLPKYRGAAPINWALINGETRTGVTIIRMNEKMDAGDILARHDTDIPFEINARDLREKLADLGASVLAETISLIGQGLEKPTPQNEKEATFAPKLTRETGRIDWDDPAGKIHNLVRGLVPWPCAETDFKGKKLKILETEIFSEEKFTALPGTVIKLIPEGIVVVSGRGSLLLKRVHLEASKPMDGRSFSVGHAIRIGDIFGGEK
ncbi:MAG: methionyl-tRNA formyltransferase [Candidatus Omnitrophota bacterium]